MKKFKYEYEDPTGGGDDGVLILPQTFRPPWTLRVTSGELDEVSYLDLVDEEGEEVEDDALHRL